MDAEIIKIVGQIAGLGGIAVGTLLLLYRDIIRKNIFSKLGQTQGFVLLVLIIVLVWIIALSGIGAWVYVKTTQNGSRSDGNTPIEEYPISGVVVDDQGNGIPDSVVFVVGGVEKDQTTSTGSFSLKVKGKALQSVRLQATKDGYKPWNDNVGLPNTNLRILLKPLDPIKNTKQPTPKTGNSPKKPNNKNGVETDKPPIINSESVNRPA